MSFKCAYKETIEIELFEFDCKVWECVIIILNVCLTVEWEWVRDGQGQVDPVSSQPSSAGSGWAGAIQTTCNGQSSQSHRSYRGSRGQSPSMCTAHCLGIRRTGSLKIAHHMLTDDGLNKFWLRNKHRFKWLRCVVWKKLYNLRRLKELINIQ